MNNKKKILTFAAVTLMGVSLVGGSVFANGMQGDAKGYKGHHMMGEHGEMHMQGEGHSHGGYGQMGEAYQSMSEEDRAAFRSEMHAVMEKYMPGHAEQHQKNCDKTGSEAK